MLRKILIWLLKLFGLYEDKSDTPTPSMTEYERRIYSILLKLGDDYKVIPQVNMASIIRKKNNDHYYSDLFRNIDFAIFVMMLVLKYFTSILVIRMKKVMF